MDGVKTIDLIFKCMHTPSVVKVIISKCTFEVVVDPVVQVKKG